MPDVLVRDRSVRRTYSVPVGAIAFVVVCVATAFGVGRVTAVPAKVDAVRVENPNAFAVNVDVAGAGRSGQLGLGMVAAQGAQTFLEVVDQGTTWSVRFSYGGVETGELTVSRAELRRQGWKITVPSEVR